MPWIAQVETHVAHELTDQEKADITEGLDGTVTFNHGTGRVAGTFGVDAPTLRQAIDTALKIAGQALPTRPHTLRVLPAERWEIEVQRPDELDLVGTSEAAQILKVSKQRVAQLADSHLDFPAPIARLSAGPVYTRASIQAFDTRWTRQRTGRPKNTTTRA